MVEGDASPLVCGHKIPHRGDERLFWDETNLQSLLKSCHDRAKWKAEQASLIQRGVWYRRPSECEGVGGRRFPRTVSPTDRTPLSVIPMAPGSSDADARAAGGCQTSGSASQFLSADAGLRLRALGDGGIIKRLHKTITKVAIAAAVIVGSKVSVSGFRPFDLDRLNDRSRHQRRESPDWRPAGARFGPVLLFGPPIPARVAYRPPLEIRTGVRRRCPRIWEIAAVERSSGAT
jgi:hypothetical protein